MTILVLLEIVDFLSIIICIFYFFMSPKLIIKFTNKLLIKHTNKNAESFFLIPSLINLLIGFLLITFNILFLIFFNDLFVLKDDFLIYILIGSVVGFILGCINSILVKKKLENNYQTQIYSSNHLALIGGSVIYNVSVFVSFMIAIYLIIGTIFA